MHFVRACGMRTLLRCAIALRGAFAYKDALALFGGGSEEVKAASDQSVNYDGVTAPASQAEKESEPSFTWIHHTDGYHYKQLADGAFEPTPHTKNNDGTYTPYS